MRLHAALVALSAAAALATVPASASAQSASCPNATVVPTAATASKAGTATLCLVNQQRAAAGLGQLKLNVTLTGVAGRYANDMVAQGFFDHVSPSGSTLASRVSATSYLRGARSWGLAENIAWGQATLSTPQAIVTSWMNSAGHRANLLDPKLLELGVGVSIGAPRRGLAGPAATYVHDFGRRR